MHIRQREAVFQLLLRLIGLEEHADQAATCYLLLQGFLLVTFTDDEKYNIEPMPQALCRIEDDAELVRTAEIARVTDDETIRHVPLSRQRIHRARQRRDIGGGRPIRHHPHRHTRRKACHECRHARTEHHIRVRCTQRLIARIQVNTPLAYGRRLRCARVDRRVRLSVL